MKTLQVLLLGPPKVQLNAQEITIPRRTPRTLLFYLASRGGMVSRPELLSLFCENLPKPIAQTRLRDTISRLRSALRESNLLIITPEHVGLDLERVSIDQLEFQELIDQAGRIPWQGPRHNPLPESTYQILLRAVTLWRGSQFMAGAKLPKSAGLDRWLSQTSQRLTHLHGAVLERLADHLTATHQLSEALQCLRLALLNDELNEDLHYRVLSTLIQMGRRSEAREYFEYVQNLFRSTLDVSPSPRLIELYRQVRDERHPLPHPEPQPRWNIRPSFATPFVGRQAVLGQLHRLRARGGAVLLLGEAGQGKTRLMQEFTRQLDDRPRLALSICRPAENNLPFQPIIELLRAHVHPDEWLSLPPVWLNQLTLLLPELASLKTGADRSGLDLIPEGGPEQARNQLLEAIRQVFVLISQKQPLVFCLDDAHWADEATLSTLTYLLERFPFNESALMLIAAREGEPSPAFERLLTALKQSTRATLLSLPRMDEADVAELARLVLGYAPPEDVSRQISRWTGGNPFFALETLQALQESGYQGSRPFISPLPVTGTVQSLLQARLHNLSSKARRLLEIAAVHGQEFNSPLVETISGMSRDEVIQALDEMVRRRLIEPAGGAPGEARYRFIHSLVREALLQELHPLRRSELHRQVAHVLEKQMSAQVAREAAVLAQHFEWAGEYERAFEYWVRAGQRARHLLAPADAASAFGRAERLLHHKPRLSDAQIHTLFAEWTELAYEMGDPVSIRGLSESLMTLARERGSPLLIGTALNRLSDACMATNQYEEGLQFAEQAISFLEQADNDYEHMEAYNHRGTFLYFTNRWDEAVQSFQDALAIGAESDNLQVLRARANAHYQIAIVQTLKGWPAIGESHAIRSLADYMTLDRHYGQVMAYSALALSRYLMGRYAQAKKDAQVGIQLAERIQAGRMLGYLYVYASMICLNLGDIDEALSYAARATREAEIYGFGETLSGANRTLGDLYYWLSAIDVALSHYQRGVQSAPGEFMGIELLSRMGLLQCLIGQRQEGQANLSQAMEIAEQSGLEITAIQGRMAQASVYSHYQEWEPAVDHARQAFRNAAERGLPEVWMIAILVQGYAALEHQDLAEAEGHFNLLAREAQRIGHVWLELRARLGLIQSARQAGQSAPEQVRRVQEILDSLEARATNPNIQPLVQRFKQQTLEQIE